jgi:hypothetical protein
VLGCKVRYFYASGVSVRDFTGTANRRPPNIVAKYEPEGVGIVHVGPKRTVAYPEAPLFSVCGDAMPGQVIILEPPFSISDLLYDSAGIPKTPNQRTTANALVWGFGGVCIHFVIV